MSRVASEVVELYYIPNPYLGNYYFLTLSKISTELQKDKAKTLKKLKLIIYSLFWVVPLLSFIDIDGQKIQYDAKDNETQEIEKEYKDSIRAFRDSIVFEKKIKDESYEVLQKRNGKPQIVVEVPTNKSPRRAFDNDMVIVGASFVSMGILYTMPESVTNWSEEDKDFSNAIGKWKENVSKGPVLDKDNFMLNWVMHPYFGALYYQALRGAGYNWKASFLNSAIASTFFWEYGIEALAEVPSQQDLWITPLVGSALGEVFYRLRLIIKRHDDRMGGSLFLGRTSLFIMDPLNELHDIFLRKRIRKNLERRSQFSSYFAPSQRGLQIGMTLTF